MRGGPAVTKACVLRVLLAVWVAASAGFSAVADGVSGEKLSNPDFERTLDGRADGWSAFEAGYVISRDLYRSGRTAIRCSNVSPDERRGATAVVRLQQRVPRPILVEGYSRAENVGGFRNNDYSIYVDLYYVDGTPLWGQTAPFGTGTHDWEHRRVLIWPQKPVRELYVHALFRHHTGTVWFDDFSVRELDPAETFDGQAISAPTLALGASSGWFVRDVAANSGVVSAREAESRLGVVLKPLPSRVRAERSVRVTDRRGTVRCVTVYYAERIQAAGASWWQDMRRSMPVSTSGEYANLTRLGAGATGMQSLYPLACVTGKSRAWALAVPPSQGAAVVRFGLHASTGLFYAAFDVALCPDSVYNSRAGRGFAVFRLLSWSPAAHLGFRGALADYYRMFPEYFGRRAKPDGLWIPFADPATVRNVADFGIAYHEGDNSVESDDRLGILSFRYTEPMTWWMPMPPEVPRTYEAALDMVEKHLRGSDPANRALAQALVHSGSHGADGRYNVEFQNAPWTNGAVWVLNPNPSLPAPAGEATKASLSFGPQVVRRLYDEPSRTGVLDGEYLDSLEGWADVLDYRPESIRHSRLPPTFSNVDMRPVVPTWFSAYELARVMRDELRKRGKLLMANATPWRIHAFAPLLDVMGTETNWMPGGRWQPDSDEVFCMRRALSYHKPYLLLQNTDFDRFTSDYVERYMLRCLFYAVFPSMFSVDASTRNYWTQPQWYERDRHLFRRYVPLIARLSRAGWEPVTGAQGSDAEVYIERYGTEYLTVMNTTTERRRTTIRLRPELLRKGERVVRIVDELSGDTFTPASTHGRMPSSAMQSVTVTLEPEGCRMLRLYWSTTRATGKGKR